MTLDAVREMSRALTQASIARDAAVVDARAAGETVDAIMQAGGIARGTVYRLLNAQAVATFPPKSQWAEILESAALELAEHGGDLREAFKVAQTPTLYMKAKRLHRIVPDVTRLPRATGDGSLAEALALASHIIAHKIT